MLVDALCGEDGFRTKSAHFCMEFMLLISVMDLCENDISNVFPRAKSFSGC